VFPEKHRRSDAHNPNENHADDNDQRHRIHIKIPLFLSRIPWLSQKWCDFSDSEKKWHGNEHTIPHRESEMQYPLLYADPSSGYEMQNQKNDADDKQKVD